MMKPISLFLMLVATSVKVYSAPIVTDNTISWPDDGWYQVQDEETYEEICSGTRSCTVDPGRYIVINHSTGERFKGIEVTAGNNTDSEVVVSGNTISWPDNGWYQVQDEENYLEICGGTRFCTVDAGTYVVINHSTGERFESIDVVGNTTSDSPIVVDGNVISWPDDGWYQVQDEDTYTEVCNGTRSCTVPSGSYVVINHSIGKRYKGIIVEDVPVADGVSMPDFHGELAFASILIVDVDTEIQANGYSGLGEAVVSRDGQTVRISVIDENRVVRGHMLVNTETSEFTWLATDMAPGTHLLFDAENQPVAVYASDCMDLSYSPMFSNNVVDLTALIPTERCLSDDHEVSADGNVVLIHSYTPQRPVPSEELNRMLLAYTIDTATLIQEPDMSLYLDGVKLDPLHYFGYEHILSDDGRQLFRKIWWYGLDDEGDALLQVGATLWKTSTNDWLTRGQAIDYRDCRSLNPRRFCAPPYVYAMSTDGQTQFFTTPTSERLDDGSTPIYFNAYLESARTGSTESSRMSDISSLRSLDANNDGNLLLFNTTSESAPLAEGYTLYEVGSDTTFLLNRALRGCKLEDEVGDPISESDCEYSTIPYSTTSDAEAFTADGRHVLLRSISRFTDDRQQSVDDFFIDIDEAAVYTLPAGFNADPNFVSADASVFVSVSDRLLIGKR